MPQLDRCLRCGSGLRRELTRWSEVLPPRRAQRVERYVEAQAQELRHAVRAGRSGLRRLWNIFWYQVDTAKEDVIVRKSPTLAGLLSLAPGLGHVHLGRRDIGGRVFLACLACAGTVALTVHSWVSNLVLLVLLFAYAGEIAWAVAHARSLNDPRPIRRELAAGVFFSIGLLCTIYTAAAFGGYNYWRMGRMEFALAPAAAGMGERGRLAATREVLSRGDTMLLDVRRTTAAALRPGDLVMYRLAGGAPATIQRVLGIAGDQVAVTAAGFTRNGLAFGPGQEPLLPQAPLYVPEAYAQLHLQPTAMALAVPSDSYAILNYEFGFVEEHEATQNQGLRLIAANEVIGKVIAICNPPAHRRWLG